MKIVGLETEDCPVCRNHLCNIPEIRQIVFSRGLECVVGGSCIIASIPVISRLVARGIGVNHRNAIRSELFPEEVREVELALEISSANAGGNFESVFVHTVPMRAQYA